MLYVGRELPDPNGRGTDRCLVDDSARVSSSSPDVRGTGVPYWPSYSEITPNARLAYLRWLADGRRDPDYGICYPFLFLYGLERRLLHDGGTADAPLVAAEMDRLLGIYGDNQSFRNYGSALRNAAIALWENAPAPEPRHDLGNSYVLPVDVRAHLGRRLAAGAPLDADDALLWILGMPDTRIRTATERCFPELRSLWQARFAAKHPSGMRVAIPKTKLRVRYPAASGSFVADVVATFGGKPVPDVVNVASPIGSLRETFDGCVDELGPYSRLLGKNPQARGTAEAAFLLPDAIRDTAGGASLRELRAKVAALLDGRPIATVAVPSLLEALGLPPPPAGKVTAAFCNQLGSMLDRLDLAIEPDRRYGSPPVVPNSVVKLFKAPGGAPVDASRDAYRTARTMVEVAALAAASDGNADDGEFEAIKGDIRATPDLGATERARLLALAAYALRDGPKPGATLAKLAKLPSAEKRRVARSAMSAVLADGHASAAEVRFLEKLHKTLGIPGDEIYSAIHRGAVQIDEPTVVAVAEMSLGIPIPAEGKSIPRGRTEPDGFRIDHLRLERIRSETSAVSSLLAGIFEEEAETAVVAGGDAGSVRTPDAAMPGFDGLDPAHSELLRTVVVTGSMDRDGFEALARRLKLLPDGAIETINEWAFDRHDEPALEADARIEVPGNLRARLAAVHAAG